MSRSNPRVRVKTDIAFPKRARSRLYNRIDVCADNKAGLRCVRRFDSSVAWRVCLEALSHFWRDYAQYTFGQGQK